MIATWGWPHYFSMRLLLSLLLIAGGISACIYRLRLRWLGSVSTWHFEAFKESWLEVILSTLQHTFYLFGIFIGLLFSCLMFSRLHYLARFSIRELRS